MSDSWLWMTAAELGRGIGTGAIDAVELAEVYLAAIDSHPAGPGIYARTTPERARAEASAAAARARDDVRRGPLDGVPVSWKDLFDTAGTATEAGSALLQGRVPERDAAVVAAATRAGLVCLGKTHMTELAFSGLGVNPVTATPPNINDPELAPGGSSSGAAASVAFGLAAAGIGSDTGGSVRVPAAWNDLVGLKTSHGALPLDGVVPLAPRFDTVGPLCRSVEDAALLFAAMAGRPAADLAGARLDAARLLVCDDPELGPNRAGPEAAFEATVERLAASGARVERGRLPAAMAALPLAACV
jgi:aspartyl-tRNA(Asn)/glutamyl-tRNA(Gln) amidotransferase subunit A